jgi:hypothetical protein
MPYQNRVSPNGEIFRSPSRGTFMGNRGGTLHNERREIVRHLQPWARPTYQIGGTSLYFTRRAYSA